MTFDQEERLRLDRATLLSGLDQLAKWGESDDPDTRFAALTSAKMSIEYVAWEVSGQAFINDFETEDKNV